LTADFSSDPNNYRVNIKDCEFFTNSSEFNFQFPSLPSTTPDVLLNVSSTNFNTASVSITGGNLNKNLPSYAVNFFDVNINKQLIFQNSISNTQNTTLKISNANISNMKLCLLGQMLIEDVQTNTFSFTDLLTNTPTTGTISVSNTTAVFNNLSILNSSGSNSFNLSNQNVCYFNDLYADSTSLVRFAFVNNSNTTLSNNTPNNTVNTIPYITSQTASSFTINGDGAIYNYVVSLTT